MAGFMGMPSAPIVDMIKMAPTLKAQDEAVAGGLAFLVGELEKRDPKLREPLTSVTYPRDIYINTGGGWVETTSNYNVSYASSGGEDGGIIADQTNDIPIMTADIGKDIFKVFTWAHIMKVPFLDQAKLQTIGRSLDQMLDKGIRLGHDKTMDRNVYEGFPRFGTYGIVNHSYVTAVAAPNGAAGKATWADKTPDEMLNDVNEIMNATWEASEYDLSGMAQHILIPPRQYARLVQSKVSEAGNVSILEFLLNNNIGKNQGIDLSINPCRWCIGAGTSGVDRMVGYVNDEDRLQVDETVPLQRGMSGPDITNLAYLTAYFSQFGQVKFLYYEPTLYMDGI